MATLEVHLVQRAAWMADASCRGMDPEIFMFEGDARVHIAPARKLAPAKKLARARAICRTCPVQAECLAYACDGNEPGVWAGTTWQERRKIRRARNAA